MNRAAMKEFLNRISLSFIIISYTALAIALYEQLKAPVLIFGGLCALWRIAQYHGRLMTMPRMLLVLVAIVSCVLTVRLVYPLGVFVVMLHLIFLGFSLKFLELRSVRDVYYFVNTGLILVGLYFIFNSSITDTLIAALLLLLLLATLLSLHAEKIPRNLFASILFKTCLLSLPLALLLFVIMPRLPSLWKMPLQKQATTGLSDSVTPGAIAKLSRSSELAFRVAFTEQLPAVENRYWRALVLDNFDGKTWSQSPAKKAEESAAKSGDGLRFNAENSLNSYEIIIEPHYNYWLPVLDFAVTPSGLVSLSDYALRSDQPIITRRAFNIEQTGRVTNRPLSAYDIARLTQLPLIGNQQTDQWIENNINNGMSKENLLTQLLTGFSLQNFRYTLNPPLLGEHQIDDFLFNTKAGFCVHYASSYLYVARRLGIPARMVTGYLGGEFHAQEGFLTLRQYDAHAWVEIWQNEHWQRVDPTSYVAPERVESGLQASLNDPSEFLANEYFSLQKWQNISLLNTLRSQLAQIDYLWARWVVNYDNQKQVQLLQQWLTLLPWLNIALAIMIMMATILVVIGLIIFKPWVKRFISDEDKIYLQLQKGLLKRGIQRSAGQTVSDYCAMISAQCAVSDDLSSAFSRKYNTLKYQPNLALKQRHKDLKQLAYVSQQLQKEVLKNRPE